MGAVRASLCAYSAIAFGFLVAYVLEQPVPQVDMSAQRSRAQYPEPEGGPRRTAPPLCEPPRQTCMSKISARSYRHVYSAAPGHPHQRSPPSARTTHLPCFPARGNIQSAKAELLRNQPRGRIRKVERPRRQECVRRAGRASTRDARLHARL